MSEPDSRNLTLHLEGFGPLVIQPEEASEDEIGHARYVLFPDHIPSEKFAAALEWAAASEAPVFCTAADLKRFEEEGFGAYRFHVLGGFREVGFEHGSLRFIPARRKHATGWRGVVEDLADAWGWSRREAFHVVVKAPGEETILYLATPFVDRAEWAVLSEERPTRVYGSAHFGRVYWTALSERLGVSIRVAADDARKGGGSSARIFGAGGQLVEARSTASRQRAPGGGDASWTRADRDSGS